VTSAGDLGEVFYVESQYWNNLEGGGGVGNWRNDPKIRHPFLGGCHALDLTRFIAGDIVEVSAYANHLAFKEQPTDDCITGQLVFESGAVGRALVASGCKCPFVTTLSVYGTEGSIEGGRICRARGATKQEWRWEELSPPQMPPPIEGEAAAFIEAIITDTPPPVEARDGLHTMAACFAVIDSAAQGGQPVRTPRMD